ncbi:phage protein Gp27 family protein [Ancylobacter defluvii]|uniref:DUF3486 family protein n=1 Tax=Ancylobacter defluvii TaxID=1282440 RepID=A0A9W6K013_9HYPH|nr:phage protein Gp27 family protein [Ancylobacter defluvii]MBS7586420.1 DUF3486 family protein [Ancylobacter defluvii]GLK85701.1 hypothetical protein GCM10017653_37710 [Ancylobacter defluvii]
MAGRGRLNSLDLLPPEAEDDVVWACQQLAARTRTISDIHFEFNDRLEAKGIETVSRSAFYRAAADRAAAQTRMQRAREMFKGIASEFTAEDVDENTIILGEFIKTLIIELTHDAAGVKTPKAAMELARAFQATVAAQKISTDRRQKIEAAAKAKLEKVAVAAVAGAVGAGATVDPVELLNQIRQGIYGMFDE